MTGLFYKDDFILMDINLCCGLFISWFEFVQEEFNLFFFFFFWLAEWIRVQVGPS